MRDVPGIAGSVSPEQEGCFLCRDEREVDWFVRLNNTGGPLDVWAIEDVEEEHLVESPEGYPYLEASIPPEQVVLFRRDIQPMDRT
jgi:hypothetical protein